MKKILLMLFGVLACGAVAFGRQPEKGQRTFVDVNNSLHAEIAFYGGESNSRYYVGASAVHGYQFNRHLFVGGGAAFEIMPKDGSLFTLPVFADVRYDMKFGGFTPFLDGRLGYNFVDGGGLYASPMVGYRFNWGRKTAINFGVGATFNGYRYPAYFTYWTPESGMVNEYIGTKHAVEVIFSFRLGLEF